MNNWIPLNSKKEPPFDVKLLICFNEEWNGKIEWEWVEAWLERIEVTQSGKKYYFSKDEFKYDKATHYCIPTEPKN